MPAYAEIRWSDRPSRCSRPTISRPACPKRLDAHLSRIVAHQRRHDDRAGTNSYFVGTRDLVLIDPGPLDDRHVAALIAHGDGASAGSRANAHTATIRPPRPRSRQRPARR
jgi:hypothetical protein